MTPKCVWIKTTFSRSDLTQSVVREREILYLCITWFDRSHLFVMLLRNGRSISEGSRARQGRCCQSWFLCNELRTCGVSLESTTNPSRPFKIGYRGTEYKRHVQPWALHRNSDIVLWWKVVAKVLTGASHCWAPTGWKKWRWALSILSLYSQ